MKKTTRIPAEIRKFNDYINSSDDYLQATPVGGVDTNWKRLGITATNSSDWEQKRKYWQDTLYPKYVNTDIRTKAVTKEVQNFKTTFGTFARPLLNLMAASPNANVHDEEALNFVINRKKPTRPTNPITEMCFATLEPIGGNEVRAQFRTNHDTKRPSLAAGANCVQIAAKVGGTPPTNEYDGTLLAIAPRATYMHSTGTGNAGKTLYVFSRWYNSKHPTLAGPWSAVVTVMIV